MIQVLIKNTLTGDIYEVPFTSINYVEELNNGRSGTIDFDYMAIKAIASIYKKTVTDLFTAVLTEISILLDGTIIFVGVVSEYRRSLDASGNYSLTVAVVDYFALLQKRRTGSTTITFTATDPATIPWSLIHASQILNAYSDLGITQGVAQTTATTVTIDYKNAEIKQEIVNLSNANANNSFDIDIDNTKKLNVYVPYKGTLRPEIILDVSNIITQSVDIPLVLNMTNSVFYTGQGINNDIAIATAQSPNSVMSAYKLLEDVVSNSTVSDSTLLASLALRYLMNNQAPLLQVTLSHFSDTLKITNYDVGDFLIINIPEENISNGQYRVRRRTVSIDSAGTITAELYMLIF